MAITNLKQLSDIWLPVGQYTNHRGKRTCASCLLKTIQHNVAKQMTVNRSTAGMEAYISASIEQHMQTSKILEPPPSKKRSVSATLSVPPPIIDAVPCTSAPAGQAATVSGYADSMCVNTATT